jgi:murein DD-endopeptidase MepM/ murein hydrolase activator NlpD
VKRLLRIAAPGLLLATLLGCASTPRHGTVHVLKSGETIYRLSRYYDVPVDRIVRENRIRDVSDVPVGARLVIPGARRGPAQQPIALASVAPVPPRLPDARITEKNFAWPIQGRLSSRYGWRRGRPHEGIDIAARSGTPIRAAEAGRVIHSGWLGGYGRVVIVKHTGNYSTVYAHNRKNLVREGAFVERGQVLAEVGSSGNASGPHLHFEVRRSRKPQDPLAYLP